MQKGVDYIGVGIGFFCHDGQGNFVMAKRGQKARDEQGRWDIGGGSIELGQTVEETLRKEIREEYCTEVLEYAFLGYRDVLRTQEGKSTHWLVLEFKVLIDPATVKNGEPHKFDEVRWFTIDTLPDNLHSQMPDLFRLYRDKLQSPVKV